MPSGSDPEGIGVVCGNGAAASAVAASSVASMWASPCRPGNGRCMDALDALHEEIRTHTGCGFAICEEAQHIVPGEGADDADVMIVGEAPGASEDKAGPPFVRRAREVLRAPPGAGG